MAPRAGLDQSTILEAAVQLADRDGLESLSIATLAQKLQVRPPSLYNHINGLAELRAKLAVHGCRLLIDQLTRRTVGRSGDDAMRSMADAYLAFARTHPGLYEAIQRAPSGEDETWTTLAQDLVNLVVQVLEFYKLDEETATHAVRGFRSLIHGFSSLERSGSFGLPLDRDASYQFLIDAFLAGLHKTVRD